MNADKRKHADRLSFWDPFWKQIFTHHNNYERVAYCANLRYNINGVIRKHSST